MPTVVIGFNKDVAWSHTVTAATHFTTFKLALDAGDSTGTTYLIDGDKNKMTSKTVSVDVLMDIAFAVKEEPCKRKVTARPLL